MAPTNADSETIPVDNVPPHFGQAVVENLMNVLSSILTTTQTLIEDHGQAFLVSLLTLILAWLTAIFIRSFTAKILRAAGLDLVAERSGLRAFLTKREITTRPSTAVGWLLYFAVIYTAFIVVFDLLELTAASSLLRSMAGYVPQMSAAGMLLVIGVLAGKWAEVIVARLARVSGIPGHKLLGTGARIAVFLLAAVFAINSLGWIAPDILLGGLATILTAGLAMALLFILSGRDLVQSILARTFITSLYNPGDHIQVDGIEGVLLSIEPTSARIDCGGFIAIIPNHTLTTHTVRVTKTTA